MTPDASLDECPSCGAPVAPTAGGECAYCQYRFPKPSDRRGAQGTYSAITIDARSGSGLSGAGKAINVIILVVVLLAIGGVAVGIYAASRTASEVTEAFTSATELPGPEATLPFPGVRSGPTSTGFVTPVANPRVKAPVNDLAAAAAAVRAKAGRPLMLSDIHLYPDGRIIFEVQAPDDPTGADNFIWKGGEVSGPEQSPIGVKATELFPLEGLQLSNLAQLCDNALAAVGIADGVIESPYLLKISRGLTWYIPVQSEARSTTRKTYWVGPDGSKPQVN